jgi:phosphoenolpyruvate-protein kinase (PTS system EI component)
MAASREGALLLAGLGYRELSMAPTSIRQVRHALGSSHLSDVEAAMKEIDASDAFTAESFAAALRAKHRGAPAPV